MNKRVIKVHTRTTYDSGITTDDYESLKIRLKVVAHRGVSAAYVAAAIDQAAAEAKRQMGY